jgi:hypothetical protein
MTDIRKTALYVGVALVLALVAWTLSPTPITPDAFLDQGEPFFPEFTDPNEATTLEVIDYNEETGSAYSFKVQFKRGLWTIPSHHNYPADGQERLASTAAGVIDVKKDDFRSDNVADHEACGVIDPLDQSVTGLSGRGKRITLRNEQTVLADFIVGKEVAGKSGFRFVRVPDQKRVYACRMNIDLSTRFEDWIEKNLLELSADNVTRVILRDYSINERTLQVDQRENTELKRSDDGKWRDARSGGREVDSTRMAELLKALEELTISGVRPKPTGLSANLKSDAGTQAMAQSDILSLQSKGFYLTRDGQLLSNEGELQVWTDAGVRYTLRFGEILYGSGLQVSSGEKGGDRKDGGAENRYLFLTTEFDNSFFATVAKPGDLSFQSKPDSLWTDADRANKEQQTKYNNWRNRLTNGKKLSDDLNARFADWYYVISGASFDQLNPARNELLSSKS